MAEKQVSDIVAEGGEVGKRYLNIFEGFFRIGKKLYETSASTQQPDFLVQQAHVGFAKILMSLRGFLGLISSERKDSQKWNDLFDRSSPSVLGTPSI
jgi:hypothetical protein